MPLDARRARRAWQAVVLFPAPPISSDAPGSAPTALERASDASLAENPLREFVPERFHITHDRGFKKLKRLGTLSGGRLAIVGASQASWGRRRGAVRTPEGWPLGDLQYSSRSSPRRLGQRHCPFPFCPHTRGPSAQEDAPCMGGRSSSQCSQRFGKARRPPPMQQRPVRWRARPCRGSCATTALARSPAPLTPQGGSSFLRRSFHVCSEKSRPWRANAFNAEVGRRFRSSDRFPATGVARGTARSRERGSSQASRCPRSGRSGLGVGRFVAPCWRRNRTAVVLDWRRRHIVALCPSRTHAVLVLHECRTLAPAQYQRSTRPVPAQLTVHFRCSTSALPVERLKIKAVSRSRAACFVGRAPPFAVPLTERSSDIRELSAIHLLLRRLLVPHLLRNVLVFFFAGGLE